MGKQWSKSLIHRLRNSTKNPSSTDLSPPRTTLQAINSSTCQKEKAALYQLPPSVITSLGHSPYAFTECSKKSFRESKSSPWERTPWRSRYAPIDPTPPCLVGNNPNDPRPGRPWKGSSPPWGRPGGRDHTSSKSVSVLSRRNSGGGPSWGSRSSGSRGVLGMRTPWKSSRL